MLSLETKKLNISEILRKKVNIICKFTCVKPTYKNSNIRNIKETNTEKYNTSKKSYMKSSACVSELQDNYWKQMNDNNFKLKRDIKNSDNEHFSIEEF